MQLPYVNSTLLAWLDPNANYVNLNNASPPNVQSLANRVSSGTFAQGAVPNQPKTTTAINNNVGTLSFAPTQYLTSIVPSLPVLNGTKAFSVTLVAMSTTNLANNLVSLYNASQSVNGNDQFNIKQVTSNGITVTRTDSGGLVDTVTANNIFLPNVPAVITATWDLFSLTLRINGVQIANSPITSGSITLNTMVVGTGPATQASPFTTGFTGSMGDVIVTYAYTGINTGMIEQESYFMKKYNITPNANATVV